MLRGTIHSTLRMQRLHPVQQGMAVVQRQLPIAVQDVIDDRRDDVVGHLIDIKRHLTARFRPRHDGRQMFLGKAAALVPNTSLPKAKTLP